MSASAAVTKYTSSRFANSSTLGIRYSLGAAFDEQSTVGESPYDLSAASVRHTVDLDSRWSLHFARLAHIRETERPSAAYVFSWLALRNLAARDFEPTRVVRSAEGGLAICFVKGDLYGDLEFLDNGSILGVVSNRRERPIVWQIDAGADDLSAAIDRISEFFNAPSTSPNARRRPWFGRWFQT